MRQTAYRRRRLQRGEAERERADGHGVLAERGEFTSTAPFPHQPLAALRGEACEGCVDLASASPIEVELAGLGGGLGVQVARRVRGVRGALAARGERLKRAHGGAVRQAREAGARMRVRKL